MAHINHACHHAKDAVLAFGRAFLASSLARLRLWLPLVSVQGIGRVSGGAVGGVGVLTLGVYTLQLHLA